MSYRDMDGSIFSHLRAMMSNTIEGLPMSRSTVHIWVEFPVTKVGHFNSWDRSTFLLLAHNCHGIPDGSHPLDSSFRTIQLLYLRCWWTRAVLKLIQELISYDVTSYFRPQLVSFQIRVWNKTIHLHRNQTRLVKYLTRWCEIKYSTRVVFCSTDGAHAKPEDLPPILHLRSTKVPQ